MNRSIIFALFLLHVIGAYAQGTIRGKVMDKKTGEPVSFVNVNVSARGSEKVLTGVVTDMDGAFLMEDVKYGDYTLSIAYLGYKPLKRDFTLNAQTRNRHFNALYLTEDSHTLGEVTVTGQRSEMKLEVDRKSFSVDQQISNAGGSASDVLENIPSVEVDNDGNVSLRGNESVEVWINGKASGLTSDNRAEILQQLPAESIERIEVIDNPSAKFSAEGSAGIINIVLKKDRKAGYYGSLQAGADTRRGANTSFNINYNSKWMDAYLNVGFRHRHSNGGNTSEQTYTENGQPPGYINYDGRNSNQGNNLFTRAGLTFHLTTKDDLSLSGMLMHGGRNNSGLTTYHYGVIGATAYDTRRMTRSTRGDGDMNMLNGELNYRHEFSTTHFLDAVVSFNRWKSDNENYDADETIDYTTPSPADGQASELEYHSSYKLQSRPMHMNNRNWEVKVDYENPISEKFKLQAGYNGRFSHENSPQESWSSEQTGRKPDAGSLVEDQDYYNRFIYDMDVHALYATLTCQTGKFGIMGGLRGEYWQVDTKSYDWNQEHHTPGATGPTPFRKDYFQLFPSIFMSYQLTPTGQLQLNYTRRLRRPWGGQLNPFKNTRDATVISYGNPELTPEYSNSFSLNYLKTWTQHSLLISAYYRPTTDVMQRISYRSSADGLMYQTHLNVARSTSTGLELTAKNKLFRIIDLSTSANFYYYKLNGFQFDIDGQTITGEGTHSFTWNARMQASAMLPYGISMQLTGRYRSRQAITQGYRKSNLSMDAGLRKSFLNKQLTVSVSCRDVFNSRRWRTYTSSQDFTRHQENWRTGRRVGLTLTWNFGNMTQKKRPQERPDVGGDEFESSGFQGGGEE